MDATATTAVTMAVVRVRISDIVFLTMGWRASLIQLMQNERALRHPMRRPQINSGCRLYDRTRTDVSQLVARLWRALVPALCDQCAPRGAC